MERKQKLLSLIERAYDIEKGMLMDLPEEERARLGTFESWATKDVLAHTSAWIDRLADNIVVAREGGTYLRDEDYNHQNELFFRELSEKPWQAVLNFAEEANRKIIGVVEALDEEMLASDQVLPWQNEGQALWQMISGNSCAHPMVHWSEHCQKRGDVQKAVKMIQFMVDELSPLDDSPNWQGTNRYNTACALALLGKKEQAVEELSQALQLNPSLAEWSRQDSDLDSIRDEPGYEAIYAGLTAEPE